MGGNNDNPVHRNEAGNASKLSSALDGNGVEHQKSRPKVVNDKEGLGDGQSSSTKSMPINPLTTPKEKILPLHNTKSTKGQKKETEKNGAKNGSKKDKAKLRKGKWTVEEEEYTSRIIHNFSTGLLMLPEGATLRSYLAERLNCDPMRITKKFTGACCLGRRVYHLRDRQRASPAEVEMAKAEINHLEQRFRMRVEQEQSGIPLAKRRNTLLAQRQNGGNTIFPLQNPPPGNMVPLWMQNYQGVENPLSLGLSVGNYPLQSQYPLGSINPTTSPWILLNTPDTALPTTANTSIPQNEVSIQILNNLVASWAWAQATAPISPAAVKMLKQQQQQQNEDHQRQLRSAFEEQKKEMEQRQLEEQKREERKAKTTPKTESRGAIADKGAVSISDIKSQASLEISPAEQLQRSYKAHLESLKKAQNMNKNLLDATSSTEPEELQTNEERKISAETPKGIVYGSSKSMDSSPNEKGSSSRIEKRREGMQGKINETEGQTDDEEAGTILLGFIKSLRQSYEDAIEENTSMPTAVNMISKDLTKRVQKSESPQKKRSLEGRSSTKITLLADDLPISSESHFPPGNHGSLRPTSVTDTSTLSRSEIVTDTSTLSRSEISSGASSHPTETSSTIGDSDSKSDKTEPSSSEESEKECTVSNNKRGPPRKRLKTGKKVKEFTEKNLAEHSKRMSEKFDTVNSNKF